jgi:hypothetical protein
MSRTPVDIARDELLEAMANALRHDPTVMFKLGQYKGAQYKAEREAREEDERLSKLAAEAQDPNR